MLAGSEEMQQVPEKAVQVMPRRATGPKAMK